MSFTKEKFQELQVDQKIKKVIFALNDNLADRKENSYIDDLINWLNKDCDYNFSTPINKKESEELIKILTEILKKENPFTEDIPYDSINKKQQNIPVILVLENIRSPHNTGSIIRSAECFNTEKVYLTGITPQPSTNVKITKTSRNAEINTEYFESIHEAVLGLRKKGYKIYTLEKCRGSVNIKEAEIIFPCALILGNEEFGVSKEILHLSDAIFHINLSGKKNSLNVSVSAGIALYELASKFNNTGAID